MKSSPVWIIRRSMTSSWCDVLCREAASIQAMTLLQNYSVFRKCQSWQASPLTGPSAYFGWVIAKSWLFYPRLPLGLSQSSIPSTHGHPSYMVKNRSPDCNECKRFPCGRSRNSQSIVSRAFSSPNKAANYFMLIMYIFSVKSVSCSLGYMTITAGREQNQMKEIQGMYDFKLHS